MIKFQGILMIGGGNIYKQNVKSNVKDALRKNEEEGLEGLKGEIS